MSEISLQDDFHSVLTLMETLGCLEGKMLSLFRLKYGETVGSHVKNTYRLEIHKTLLPTFKGISTIVELQLENVV